MNDQRAWLVDASIYIFRAWFSLPDRWHTRAGQPLNAVYGYSKFLLDFYEQVQPGPFFSAAFDESLGSCFRNEIYPPYKHSRALPDEDLAFQLGACREVTELMGVPCYSGARYEADDYLACLGSHYRRRGLPVTVVTRDKDLGQLVLEPGDRWWDFASDENLDRDGLQQRFGVLPEQLADYLALVGDPVDDLPGVPGVGAKTAARLLQVFGSIEVMGEGLEQLPTLDIRGAKKLQGRLREHWPQLLMAQQLATLETRIPGVDVSAEFQLGADQAEAVAAYLEGLNLGGPLLRRWQALAEKLAVAK